MKELAKVPLTEDNLSFMNSSQRDVVLTQWKRHQHEDFEVDYDVSGEKDMLNGFIIKKGVWNPFLASGRYHARYLFYHNELFYGKTAMDIGCGTGLMAVVMAKYGAEKVIASDISLQSVDNTAENAKKFGVDSVVTVVKSDLFEGIKGKADMITWMIPFFPGTTPPGDTIAASMIMKPELFERFLKEAPKHLNKNGVIVIPSFSLGGDLTNPEKVAKKFGYDIKTTWLHNSINGIQRGMIYMHELRINR